MTRRNVFVMTIGSVLLAGCHGSQDSPKTSAAAPAFQLKATTAQLMRQILDPHADIVWGVGGSVVTEKGEERLAPKTEAEWIVVRNAAVTVAETGNLLLLAPHARDQGDWVALTHKMITEANKCVAAIEAKDLDTLLTAGGDIFEACTECHAKYVVHEPQKN